MQFNQYVWNNFKKTKNGRKLEDFFVNYSKSIGTAFYGGDSYADNKDTLLKICNQISYKEYDLDDIDELYPYESIGFATGELVGCVIDEDDVSDDFDEQIQIANTKIINFDQFEVLVKNYVKVTIKIIEHNNNVTNLDRLAPDVMIELSHSLYNVFPKYCFPYYFNRHYYRLDAIFKEFGMFLPPVPKKTDYWGRAFHYLELCKSLYNFRIKFGLIVAFLPPKLPSLSTIGLSTLYQMTTHNQINVHGHQLLMLVAHFSVQWFVVCPTP